MSVRVSLFYFHFSGFTLWLVIAVRYQLFYLFDLFKIAFVKQGQAVGYFVYFAEIMVCQDNSMIFGAFGHKYPELFGYDRGDAAERFVEQDIRSRTEKGGFDFQVTLLSGRYFTDTRGSEAEKHFVGKKAFPVFRSDTKFCYL